MMPQRTLFNPQSGEAQLNEIPLNPYRLLLLYILCKKNSFFDICTSYRWDGSICCYRVWTNWSSLQATVCSSPPGPIYHVWEKDTEREKDDGEKSNIIIFSFSLYLLHNAAKVQSWNFTSLITPGHQQLGNLLYNLLTLLPTYYLIIWSTYNYQVQT